MNDPIADLLTRIRNGCMAKLRFIEIPHSKMKEQITKVLKEQGFIAHYLIKEENKRGTIRIFLKYTKERNPIIQGLRRYSKSSLRKYSGHNDIPRVYGGMGIAIVSTSRGVMEGEQARKEKVGGEVLCLAW